MLEIQYDIFSQILMENRSRFQLFLFIKILGNNILTEWQMHCLEIRGTKSLAERNPGPPRGEQALSQLRFIAERSLRNNSDKQSSNSLAHVMFENERLLR